VPINKIIAPYVGFVIHRKKFAFKVMPIALNVACRTVSKLMTSVVKDLTLRRVHFLNYLDDILIWGESQKECSENCAIVRTELVSRGFKISTRKSTTTQSRIFEFLGIIWNTKKGEFYLRERNIKTTLETARGY